MKYKVTVNPNFNNGHFSDTTELDKDGKMVERTTASEWIVDEERKDYLLKHNAIIILEEIAEEKSVKEKKTEKKVEKPTKQIKGKNKTK